MGALRKAVPCSLGLEERSDEFEDDVVRGRPPPIESGPGADPADPDPEFPPCDIIRC